MERLLNRLAGLESSARGPAPSPLARRLAARALAVCWRHDAVPVHLGAAADGGVFLSFWDRECYGDLEIRKNGDISLVFNTTPGEGAAFLETCAAGSVDEAVPAVLERLGREKILDSPAGPE